MKCPCGHYWMADSKTGCFNFCDEWRRPKQTDKVIYWCAICGYREEREEEPRPRNCRRCGQGMFVWEGRRDEQKR